MSAIVVSPTTEKRITLQEKLAVTLYFTLPASGKLNGVTVIPPDGKVVLAVYDLNQYKSTQAVLATGFREDDDAFFDGSKTQFPAPLQAHFVSPNSGVLFMAELQFEKRKTPKDNRFFFVKSVSKRQEHENKAYEMQIVTDTRVDEAGKDQPASPIQLGPIGTISAAREDFDEFSKNDDTLRFLVFRLLTPDLGTVLLSTLNAAHSPARVAKKVLYGPNAAPKKVGSEPKCNDVKPAAGSRRVSDDPNGLYVEVLPGQNENDPNGLTAPATLYIHQVGRMFCGWYSPLRSQLLSGNRPVRRTPIVDGDTKQMLSQNRLMFVANELLDFGNIKVQERPKGKQGLKNIIFTEAPPGELEDPDAFILIDEVTKQRVVPLERQKAGLISIVAEQVPLVGREVTRVEVSLDGKTFRVFRKIDKGSRLSWRAFKLMRDGRNDVGTKLDEFLAALQEDAIEPLPPGVMLVLTREIASPGMIALVNQFIAAKGTPLQPAVEDQINTALERLADDLRLTTRAGSMPPTLRAQVRSMARSETLTLGPVTRTVLSVLEEISGGIIEADVRRRLGIQSPNPLPANRPNENDVNSLRAAASLRGFAAFDILPGEVFTYKFTFTELKSISAELKRAIVAVKGSVGLFLMKVEKFDAKTKTKITGFVADNLVCVVLGGSFGLGVEVAIDGIGTDEQKVKPGAAAPTPKPLNCEVTTFLNLDPEEFLFSRFLFFTQMDPGFDVTLTTGAGIAAGQGQQTIFSLTLANRQPEVVLETVVKVPPKDLEAKKPDLKKTIDDIIKAAKGDKSALRQKLNVLLFGLTMMGGIVLFNFTPLRRPDDKTTPEELREEGVEGFIVAAGPSFKKQCAGLEDVSRKVLQLCLAVQRRLLEYPGYIDIQGCASPEWTGLKTRREDAGQENRDLSLRRAQFIEAEILAAAGSPGTGVINRSKEIVPSGVGSDVVALQFTTDPKDQTPGSILDPFAREQQGDKAAYDARLEKERKELYPAMRRVDFAMNGMFVLSLRAE